MFVLVLVHPYLVLLRALLRVRPGLVQSSDALPPEGAACDPMKASSYARQRTEGGPSPHTAPRGNTKWGKQHRAQGKPTRQQPTDIEFCEDAFTQLSTVRANVKILKRAHNKELPEVLPVTAAAAGLGGDLQHVRATGARARATAAAAAAAATAAAAAASDASSPAAVPAPLPTARRHASRPTYAATARAAAPPPPPAPPAPPPPRAPAAPRFDGPAGRTRSASASLVVDVPAYELAYLQDKHNYDYKPAGSFASDPAGSVLLVGSVMGEAYKVDVNVGIVPIPRSHAAAIADPVYGAKWRAACDDDFEGKYTLLKTWELVKSVPLGRRVIRGKWVFAVKYKSDGTVDKFKARYIGCGYSQVQGVDYIDSFCSTLRLESLRVFLAGACVNNDDLLEVDVVKAFPSGDWDGTEMYLQQPHGYFDPNCKACRLLRPLEGTKQAGNLWMVGNTKTIKGLGLGFELRAVHH